MLFSTNQAPTNKTNFESGIFLAHRHTDILMDFVGKLFIKMGLSIKMDMIV